MPATEAWEPVTCKVCLTGPVSRKVVGGRLMAHIPAVDGSATLSIAQVLRSRSRTRRRRRKRSWAAPWAYLLPVWPTDDPFWSRPALSSVYLSVFGWDRVSPQRVLGARGSDRQGLIDPLFYRVGVMGPTGLHDPATALLAIVVMRFWSLHEAAAATHRLTHGRSLQGRKPWHVWPELI
jgi:hypothetical protein